jgi:hypothetical protein
MIRTIFVSSFYPPRLMWPLKLSWDASILNFDLIVILKATSIFGE